MVRPTVDSGEAADEATDRQLTSSSPATDRHMTGRTYACRMESCPRGAGQDGVWRHTRVTLRTPDPGSCRWSGGGAASPLASGWSRSAPPGTWPVPSGDDGLAYFRVRSRTHGCFGSETFPPRLIPGPTLCAPPCRRERPWRSQRCSARSKPGDGEGSADSAAHRGVRAGGRATVMRVGTANWRRHRRTRSCDRRYYLSSSLTMDTGWPPAQWTVTSLLFPGFLNVTFTCGAGPGW